MTHYDFGTDKIVVGIVWAIPDKIRNHSLRDRARIPEYLNRNQDRFPFSRQWRYLLHGNMTKKEVANLYKNRSIKGDISATSGEGYGLPLVEAAAAGIPVIATNWSGH